MLWALQKLIVSRNGGTTLGIGAPCYSKHAALLCSNLVCSSKPAAAHIVFCRSAYFRLGLMLREKVACQAVLALTATATRATQTSICSVLDIPTDDVLLDSVLPQNLRLTVAKSTQGTPCFRGSW